MSNGDSRVLGLPCRFPAKPSIFAGDVTNYMTTRVFSAWGVTKNFYSEFSHTAGNGRGGTTLPVCAPLAPRQPPARQRWPDHAAHRPSTACAAPSGARL